MLVHEHRVELDEAEALGQQQVAHLGAEPGGRAEVERGAAARAGEDAGAPQ